MLFFGCFENRTASNNENITTFKRTLHSFRANVDIEKYGQMQHLTDSLTLNAPLFGKSLFSFH